MSSAHFWAQPIHFDCSHSLSAPHTLSHSFPTPSTCFPAPTTRFQMPHYQPTTYIHSTWNMCTNIHTCILSLIFTTPSHCWRSTWRRVPMMTISISISHLLMMIVDIAPISSSLWFLLLPVTISIIATQQSYIGSWASSQSAVAFQISLSIQFVQDRYNSSHGCWSWIWNVEKVQTTARSKYEVVFSLSILPWHFFVRLSMARISSNEQLPA